MSAGATMDFFGHQDAARRATRRLVVYFGLAVVGIVATVYLAAAVLVHTVGDTRTIWNPGLLGGVAVAVFGVVAIAAAAKTAQLSAGGTAVAQMLGGTPVDPGTRDPELKRFVNVVEEMSLASGVPVPRIYVLEGEAGINAFAAGWGTKDAVVAVTRGTLHELDRDELQGVVAHEFSHIFHGDMRLNIRLMGVLFGIVCIATIGEVVLRGMGRGSGGKKGAAGIALFGLALMAIGWIGWFFAGLIKAAVSRQREYLADASAVAYTRNPRGIGLALARIGRVGSRLQSVHAREASHMFFADGLSRFLGGLGATHPPIEQRIERVLPGYLREVAAGRAPEDAVARIEPPAVGAAARTPAAAAGAAPMAGVASAAVTALVGRTDSDLVEQSRQLIADLPLEVVAAARDATRAPALCCALLLQPGDARGLAVLQGSDAARTHDARAHDAQNLAAVLRDVPRTARLPVLELAIPALRSLTPPQRDELHRDLDALARADGALTTFEFALLHTVRRHVPRAGGPSPGPGRALALTSAVKEAELVLSVVAYAGGDVAAAEAAFAAGAKALSGIPAVRLRPRAECRFDDVEGAMTRLEQLSPMAKKLLLSACAAAAGADGRIAANEGELLRAFAESWDCPLPPVWRVG